VVLIKITLHGNQITN